MASRRTTKKLDRKNPSRRERRTTFERLEERQLLAVDFADVRASLTQFKAEFNDTVQDVRDARDLAYLALPSQSLKSVVANAVDARLNALQTRVNQLFTQAESIVDGSDALDDELNELASATGGQLSVSGFASGAIDPTLGFFEFTINLAPSALGTSFALPTEHSIFGIEFETPVLSGFEVNGGLSLSARIRIEETSASTRNVFLVPTGGDNRLLTAQAGISVDFGGNGFDLTGPTPTGMKTIASGEKIGDVIDYKGAIDFVFDPDFSLHYNGASSNKVAIGSLGDPTVVTPSDLELRIPVAFQLEFGPLPKFDYRTVFVVNGGGVTELASSQQVFLGGIKVVSNGVTVSRGVFINEVLKQGGFELVDKIASAIPADVAEVLLGNREVFAGLTVDQILLTNVWGNPGVFEAESDPGTPFSPLDHLQAFGIPAPVIDLLEFILQVSVGDSGSSDNNQLSGNQNGYGLQFPIVDSPLSGIIKILKKEETPLMTFNFDYVRDALGLPVGNVPGVGKIEDTPTGRRVDVNVDTQRVKDQLKETISDRLGIGGTLKQVLDRLIDQAFDNFDGHLDGHFQAGFRAGIDTKFLTTIQAGQTPNILDSFYIDATVPLVDFGFDIGLEVTASVTDVFSLSSSSLALAGPGVQPLALKYNGPTINDVTSGAGNVGTQIVGGLTNGAAAAGQILGNLAGAVETSLTAGLGVSGSIKAGFKGSGQIRASQLANPLSVVYVNADLRGNISVQGKLFGVETPKWERSGDLLNISIGANGPMVNNQGVAMNDFAEKKGTDVRVYGSVDPDNFTLGYDAQSDEILVTLSGATQRFARAGVNRVLFDLRGEFDGKTGATIQPGRSKDGGDDSVQLLASLNAMATPVFVVANGGKGKDTLTAQDQGAGYYKGQILFRGGGQNDTLIGGAGISTLYGDSGDDTITAGPGQVFMDGGAGVDVLRGLQDHGGTPPSPNGGRMVGGPGVDVITVGQLSRGSFLLIGGSIGPGDDGLNLIAGGYGNDRIIAGNAQASAYNMADLTSGVGSLVAGGPGDDTIFGTAGGDLLIGGWVETDLASGRDRIVAGGGQDLLIGSNAVFAANKIDLIPTDVDIATQSGVESLDGGAQNDTILIGIGGYQVNVLGGGGSDTVQIGFGSLHNIRGKVMVDLGAGAGDSILLDDSANADNIDYAITPNSVTAVTNANAAPGETTRIFGGLAYNGTTEFLELSATDAKNTLVTSPSLSTRYTLNGNLSATRTVPSLLGDFLWLDTDGTTGRKIKFDVPKSGNGRWSFTSGHKDVVFRSIERFNHVERLAVAAEAGKFGAPTVKVYDAETKEFLFEFAPYEADYRDGVRVATGDMDEDGIPDVIVAPGRLHSPTVKIYDGLGPEAVVRNFTSPEQYKLGQFLAYGASFQNGVEVAVGDVTGDYSNDVVVAPSRGASQVRVFENVSFSKSYRLYDSFSPYPSSFIGGVSVAAGDLTGDGRADIVTSTGSGANVEIKVFDAARLKTADKAKSIRKFTAFDESARGGSYVALANVVGTKTLDIVLGGGPTLNSRVQVFDGARLPAFGAQFAAPALEFRPFNGSTENDRAAVRVVGKDYDLDGVADAIFAAQGADGKSQLIRERRTINGSILDALFENDPEFLNGFRLG